MLRYFEHVIVRHHNNVSQSFLIVWKLNVISSTAHFVNLQPKRNKQNQNRNLISGFPSLPHTHHFADSDSERLKNGAN